MKKLIIILSLVCILSLFGCSNTNDIPILDEVMDYTEEDFEIYLRGVSREGR